MIFYFQSEGGVKSLRTGGEVLKILGLRGLFAGRVAPLLHAMSIKNNKGPKIDPCCTPGVGFFRKRAKYLKIWAKMYKT